MAANPPFRRTHRKSPSQALITLNIDWDPSRDASSSSSSPYQFLPNTLPTTISQSGSVAQPTATGSRQPPLPQQSQQQRPALTRINTNVPGAFPTDSPIDSAVSTIAEGGTPTVIPPPPPSSSCYEDDQDRSLNDSYSGDDGAGAFLSDLQDSKQRSIPSTRKRGQERDGAVGRRGRYGTSDYGNGSQEYDGDDATYVDSEHGLDRNNDEEEEEKDDNYYDCQDGPLLAHTLRRLVSHRHPTDCSPSSLYAHPNHSAGARAKAWRIDGVIMEPRGPISAGTSSGDGIGIGSGGGMGGWSGKFTTLVNDMSAFCDEDGAFTITGRWGEDWVQRMLQGTDPKGHLFLLYEPSPTPGGGLNYSRLAPDKLLFRDRIRTTARKPWNLKASLGLGLGFNPAGSGGGSGISSDVGSEATVVEDETERYVLHQRVPALMGDMDFVFSLHLPHHPAPTRRALGTFAKQGRGRGRALPREQRVRVPSSSPSPRRSQRGDRVTEGDGDGDDDIVLDKFCMESDGVVLPPMSTREEDRELWPLPLRIRKVKPAEKQQGNGTGNGNEGGFGDVGGSGGVGGPGDFGLAGLALGDQRQRERLPKGDADRKASGRDLYEEYNLLNSVMESPVPEQELKDVEAAGVELVGRGEGAAVSAEEAETEVDGDRNEDVDGRDCGEGNGGEREAGAGDGERETEEGDAEESDATAAETLSEDEIDVLKDALY